VIPVLLTVAFCASLQLEVEPSDFAHAGQIVDECVHVCSALPW
jgi:hypothetical protein